MAQKIGPNLLASGLVASYDAANIKCFKGGVTSNLLNSATNSYPKVGNTWGTYNTNQYNNGSFFSIGTVSAVTNNVVTTSAAHPLRTYDVIRPQTTGGGVTANTDYFVKKLSNTTFSLYAYDSNQDGTNGWATRAALVNDSKVSINSTSFPTMWWGYPHLPNSGLVKTIVKNAFNGHECIRLNFDRSDGIDAMAYGGDTPTLSNGVTYTYSFWYRAANDAAIGKTIAFSNHYYAVGYGTGLGTTNALTRQWQRHTATATAPATSTISLYWWPSTGGATCAMDISEIQIEVGSTATPFTPTSRGTSVSTGGGLYDLSGNLNHGTFANGPIYSYDAGGSIVFDGSDDYSNSGSTPAALQGNPNITVIGYFKRTNSFSLKGFWGIGGSNAGGTGQGICNWNYNNTNEIAIDSWSQSTFTTGQTYPLNTWAGVCWRKVEGPMTRANCVISTFNGKNITNYTGAGLTILRSEASTNLAINSIGGLTVGSISVDTGYCSPVNLGNIAFYNRVLSDSEVTRYFLALKGRFRL